MKICLYKITNTYKISNVYKNNKGISEMWICENKRIYEN